MKLAVYRKFLRVFPSANGSLAAQEIGRNFLPGIQPDTGFLPDRRRFRVVRPSMAVIRHMHPVEVKNYTGQNLPNTQCPVLSVAGVRGTGLKEVLISQHRGLRGRAD